MSDSPISWRDHCVAYKEAHVSFVHLCDLKASLEKALEWRDNGLALAHIVAIGDVLECYSNHLDELVSTLHPVNAGETVVDD